MPDNKPAVPHYDRGKIQLIDYLEATLSPEAFEGYLVGQVHRYLNRYRHKGEPLSDLLKGRDYYEWLIEKVGKEKPKEAK